MDASLVIWVRDLVKSKYGWPDKNQGSPQIGEVNYAWKLKDGVIVEVTRGWPDTTTYLSYTVPDTYIKMHAEQEEVKREAKDEKFRKQGNAF